MKILIFGGSFDPVHKGHLRLAEHAVHGYDECWFTPCTNSRYGKNLVKFSKRCEMLYDALKHVGNPKLKVCQAEDYYGTEGKMYDLSVLLKEHNPGLQFTFLIGSDTATNMRLWYRSQELIQTNRFLVVPREGSQVPSWIVPQEVCHVPKGSVPISSTRCKEMIYFTGECNLLLDSTVNYIKENRLYEKPI